MPFDLHWPFLRSDVDSIQRQSTPSSVVVSKGCQLGVLYAQAVAACVVYLRIVHWPRLTFFRLFAMAMLLWLAMSFQGVVMTAWYRLDAWNFPPHRAQRQLLPAYCLVSFGSAYLTLRLLTLDEPILSTALSNWTAPFLIGLV